MCRRRFIHINISNIIFDSSDIIIDELTEKFVRSEISVSTFKILLLLNDTKYYSDYLCLINTDMLFIKDSILRKNLDNVKEQKFIKIIMKVINIIKNPKIKKNKIIIIDKYRDKVINLLTTNSCGL